MMTLGFAPLGERIGEHYVRTARFEARSQLPVAAACVVANGFRETLAALVGTNVGVRLLEPRLPDTNAWQSIARGARCFRICGAAADAAFVLRAHDALALTCLAFGEQPGDERALSPVEERVLTRTVEALSSALAPVCGARTGTRAESLANLNGYATYFELLVEHPITARIGIALSRDPVVTGSAKLRPSDLLDVELEVTAEFARGQIDGAAMLALHPGLEVPMTTKMGELGLLKVAGTIIARAECGAVDSRYALVVRNSTGGL